MVEKSISVEVGSRRKGSLRHYQYGEGATDQIRPHAVIGIDKYSGGEKTDTFTYLYDANGNAIDANGRVITWSSFNKPVRIEKDNAFSTFAYGPDRPRYRHVKHYENGDTETTHYAGPVERIERTRGISTSIEYRQHIVAGGKVIAVVTDHRNSSVEVTRYLHRDHLGSVTLITDTDGKIVEQRQFDAWGQSVAVGTLIPDPWRVTPLLDTTTTRGFTGHETLDHLGLVHMNGRIYDPGIGRFLSADPFVQFPASTQGYNRYSYLNNNPLNATDPSGYFNLRKELGNFLGHIAPYLNFIPGCQIWCAALAGAVSGYLLTGSVQGALVNGFMGAFTGLVGGAPTGVQIGLLGTTYGALSHSSGGRFGDGFLQGAIGATAGNLSGGNPVIAAVIGGTAADIGGGKFASGAKSGFFHSLFGESLRQGFSGTSGISSTTGSDATDAALAMGVYDPEFTRAGGYELVQRFPDEGSGLNAALFANGEDRVLVFAGTDPGSWANWKANFAQAFGFKSAQYEMGMNLAIRLTPDYGSIRFTGHSLGGGIASAAAIITGGSATTFNAAGVHNNTLRGYARSNGSIRAYYSAFDMLRFGNAFTPASVAGQQISLGVAGLHGMSGVCHVAGC